MKFLLTLSLLFVMSFMTQVLVSAEEFLPDVLLSNTGLKIVHPRGTSCYDEDRIYKFCVDQKQLFEKAKLEAWLADKDLLLIYGYDKCPWSRSIHNLLLFSSESQRLKDAFVIQTIAASKGNKTGKKLIEDLCFIHNGEGYKYTNSLLSSN